MFATNKYFEKKISKFVIYKILVWADWKFPE